MNTCNLNTATGRSTQRGGKGTKPFIVQLEEMERAASKALFAFQTSGDKAALHQSGRRLMSLLREGGMRCPLVRRKFSKK